jgi:hypothetical protein
MWPGNHWIVIRVQFKGESERTSVGSRIGWLANDGVNLQLRLRKPNPGFTNYSRSAVVKGMLSVTRVNNEISHCEPPDFPGLFR